MSSRSIDGTTTTDTYRPSDGWYAVYVVATPFRSACSTIRYGPTFAPGMKLMGAPVEARRLRRASSPGALWRPGDAVSTHDNAPIVVRSRIGRRKTARAAETVYS